ncbi:GATA transcription factor 9-like [Euphorbia lathyris]|uniref:GATA transcription factor 9-like n=1 Tax=Euphorbia lathyris TaxID=212925 RepID=UPI00331418A6
MDFYRNVTFSGDYHQQDKVLASSKLGATLSPLDDLLSAQNTEVDVSMEWLSVFVEDCLSSTGNCLPAAAAAPISTTKTPQNTTTTATTKPPKPKPQISTAHENPLKKFNIPGKARSKRKRITSVKLRNPLSSWAYSSSTNKALNFPISDPLLVNHQPYWLADSELIIPKKEAPIKMNDREVEEDKSSSKESSGGGRRCSHCLSQKTPQWRGGPMGPKTLCNACGVRYKSGRLLPEYRPAKSPTFVSYLHSNSHKKVLEIRTTHLPSSSSS